MTDISENSIHNMKILIIDDSDNNISLLKAILNKENFAHVITAASASHALEKLEDFDIDLILLSFIMPAFSGIETCSLITQDMRYEDIPVIMITADTNVKTLQRSFEHGASDYIAKPINAVELMARVQSHLIRKQVVDERKNNAITDALTNIYNRRYFDLVFDRQYTKALAEHKPYTFFMIDIDNFKKFNDCYGHQKGDEALQNVAKTIKIQLNRESDYLFRLGGEEFAILLFNTNHAYIDKLSSHIHASIASLHIPHEENEDYGMLTISIGINTAIELSNISKFELYESADKALYQAKHSGRNKSVITSI